MEKTTKPREPTYTNPAPLPIANLDDAGRLACLRLIRSRNVGPTTFRDLINHYGGAKQALDALSDPATARRIARNIEICSVQDATAELEAAIAVGATPVFTVEPGYPKALANLPVPPPMVYTQGDKSLLQHPAIAIVGARIASAAGIKLSKIFAQELGQAGLIIVSGLARGIDRAAHEAALKTGTIAVVAGGVDVIYPPEHEDLHRQISQSGCLVSEMPCGFKPRAKDFPRRNRIISGLSLGVLVVEAALRSGSLVTARQAGEQNRELFAIPGHPLDPRAKGTNALIKNDGATMVTEPNDIVLALKPMAGYDQHTFREPQSPLQTPQPENHANDLSLKGASQNQPASTSTQPVHITNKDTHTPLATLDAEHIEQIRLALSPTPVELDAIARATGIGTNLVRAALLELELNGEVEHHGANLISLKST